MADEPCVCCSEPAAPGATAVEMKQQQGRQPMFTKDMMDTYLAKYGTGIYPTAPVLDSWKWTQPTWEQATPNYVPGTIQSDTVYTTNSLPIAPVTNAMPVITTNSSSIQFTTYDELKPVLDEAKEWSITSHVDSAPIYSMGEVHPTQYVASTPQVTFEWTDNWGNKDAAYCDAATVNFQKIKKDWEKGMASPGEIYKSVEIANDPPSLHHHDVVAAEEETRKLDLEAVKRAKQRAKTHLGKNSLFKKKPDGKVQ